MQRKNLLVRGKKEKISLQWFPLAGFQVLRAGLGPPVAPSPLRAQPLALFPVRSGRGQLICLFTFPIPPTPDPPQHPSSALAVSCWAVGRPLRVVVAFPVPSFHIYFVINSKVGSKMVGGGVASGLGREPAHPRFALRALIHAFTAPSLTLRTTTAPPPHTPYITT